MGLLCVGAELLLGGLGGLIFGGVNAIWLILKEREIEMALAAAEERRNGGGGERMNSS